MDAWYSHSMCVDRNIMEECGNLLHDVLIQLTKATIAQTCESGLVRDQQNISSASRGHMAYGVTEMPENLTQRSPDPLHDWGQRRCPPTKILATHRPPTFFLLPSMIESDHYSVCTIGSRFFPLFCLHRILDPPPLIGSPPRLCTTACRAIEQQAGALSCSKNGNILQLSNHRSTWQLANRISIVSVL